MTQIVHAHQRRGTHGVSSYHRKDRKITKARLKAKRVNYGYRYPIRDKNGIIVGYK